MLRTVVVVVFALALTGCQTLQDLATARPSAKVLSVEPTGVTADGVEMRVAFEVTNKGSGLALPVTAIPFDFSLNEAKVLSGRAALDEAADVPASGIRPFAVDVNVPWQSIGEGVRLVRSGDALQRVRFDFDGRLELPDRYLVSSVPLRYRGELDVLDLVQKALGSPRVLADGDFRALLATLREVAPQALQGNTLDQLRGLLN